MTEANRFECQQTLEFLREHWDTLVRHTRDFPVICEFAGWRFVFTRTCDVGSLIVALDLGLAEVSP